MEPMTIQSNPSSSYGYGVQTTAMQEAQPAVTSSNKRETYGTALLAKFDDRAYQAFINSSANLSEADRSLAARTLERAAAVSAANEYAISHDVSVTQDLAVVYRFFENYQDVVSSDQIKHLLNSRLQSRPSVEGKNFESEQFFEDFTAQLGGTRALDIRV